MEKSSPEEEDELELASSAVKEKGVGKERTLLALEVLERGEVGARESIFLSAIIVEDNNIRIP